MLINVVLKVVQFGQISLEIGKPVSFVEEYPKDRIQVIVRYRGPQETSSRVFENDEDQIRYIVPQITG